MDQRVWKVCKGTPWSGEASSWMLVQAETAGEAVAKALEKSQVDPVADRSAWCVEFFGLTDGTVTSQVSESKRGFK